MVMNAELNENVSFVVAKAAVGWVLFTVPTCQLHSTGGAGQFGEQKKKTHKAQI